MGTGYTLFADEGVISVVGIVRISGGSAPPIAYHAKVELCMSISKC